MEGVGQVDIRGEYIEYEDVGAGGVFAGWMSTPVPCFKTIASFFGVVEALGGELNTCVGDMGELKGKVGFAAGVCTIPSVIENLAGAVYCYSKDMVTDAVFKIVKVFEKFSECLMVFNNIAWKFAAETMSALGIVRYSMGLAGDARAIYKLSEAWNKKQEKGVPDKLHKANQNKLYPGLFNAVSGVAFHSLKLMAVFGLIFAPEFTLIAGLAYLITSYGKVHFDAMAKNVQKNHDRRSKNERILMANLLLADSESRRGLGEAVKTRLKDDQTREFTSDVCELLIEGEKIMLEMDKAYKKANKPSGGESSAVSLPASSDYSEEVGKFMKKGEKSESPACIYESIEARHKEFLKNEAYKRVSEPVETKIEKLKSKIEGLKKKGDAAGA